MSTSGLRSTLTSIYSSLCLLLASFQSHLKLHHVATSLTHSSAEQITERMRRTPKKYNPSVIWLGKQSIMRENVIPYRDTGFSSAFCSAELVLPCCN